MAIESLPAATGTDAANPTVSAALLALSSVDQDHATHENGVDRRRQRDNARLRRWRAANPEKHRAQQRRRDARNRSTRRAAKRRWYLRHKAERAAYLSRYYLTRQEELKLRARQWAVQHPEARAAQQRLRRSRKASAPGTCSLEQFQARWDFYGGCCWMCGMPATTIDHVLPLSRGGSEWPANLRPACNPCNARKGARSWKH